MIGGRETPIFYPPEENLESLARELEEHVGEIDFDPEVDALAMEKTRQEIAALTKTEKAPVIPFLKVLDLHAKSLHPGAHFRFKKERQVPGEVEGRALVYKEAPAHSHDPSLYATPGDVKNFHYAAPETGAVAEYLRKNPKYLLGHDDESEIALWDKSILENQTKKGIDPEIGVKEEERIKFVRELKDRLQALPVGEKPAEPVKEEPVVSDKSGGEEKQSVEKKAGIFGRAKEAVRPVGEFFSRTKEALRPAGKFYNIFKDVLGREEVQKQLALGAASALASGIGVKSFVDVPSYVVQRFNLRGGVFGVGKGLEGSIEKTIAASQKFHAEHAGAAAEKPKEKRPKNSRERLVQDLERRLAITREGTEKKSEERNMVAKLLWENRTKEKTVPAERKKEVKKLLDDFTMTKVTGYQAARESLNSLFLATHTYPLRFISSGLFEALEKKRELEKAERKKGAEQKEVSLKDAFIAGLKETYNGLRFKGESGKIIKSYAKLASFVMMSHASLGGGKIYSEALDNVVEAFSGKMSLGDMGHNFLANAERYLPPVPGFVEASVPEQELNEDFFKPLPPAEISSAIPEDEPVFYVSDPATIEALKDHSPAQASAPYQATAKIEFPDEPIRPEAEIPYQGGKSIWAEAKNQLAAREGEEFSALNEQEQNQEIDMIKNTIIENPEEFGLPSEADPNKLTETNLRGIDWDSAVEKAIPDQEVEALIPEAPAEIVNLEDVITNKQHFTPFNGSHPSESLSPKAEAMPLIHEGGVVDQEKFLASAEGKKQLEDLSGAARKFFDPKVSQNEKDFLFEKMQRAKTGLEKVLGGRLGFDPDGKINLFHGAQKEVLFAGHNSALEELRKIEIPGAGQDAVVNLEDLPQAEVHPAVENFGAADSSAVVNLEDLPQAPPVEEADLEDLIKESETFAAPETLSSLDPVTAEVLATRSGFLDLRSLTDASPDTLRALADRPDMTNLTGLKPENLHHDSLRILKKFAGQVLVSDSVQKLIDKL